MAAAMRIMTLIEIYARVGIVRILKRASFDRQRLMDIGMPFAELFEPFRRGKNSE